MFYNCYDKYGRYLGHTQTESSAKELIQRANDKLVAEVYSAWLKAKVNKPNLSLAEFELEYKNHIQAQLKDAKKQHETSTTKWVLIILIIVFLIFVLAGGN